MKPRIFRFLGAASICLGLAGCASSDRGAAEESRPARAVLAMQGEAMFLAGALRVEATVSQVQARRGPAGDLGARGGRGGHGGRRHAGYGGPGRGEEGEDGAVPALHAMGGQALTLRVRLENRSAQPIEVMIHDVASDLGSFAVRPERLLLSPGEGSEVDPMVSQLGVVAADIPVTITLRTAATTETQVLRVRAIAPQTAPAR